MFKNFIYLGLLIQFLKQPNVLAFQPITENNHLLVGHAFQRLYAKDWFNCIQACHDEPRCISYNYERSAGANGLCELNDCEVESFCNRHSFLIYSKGFVFQQMRESKDKRICTWAGNKSESQQSSGNTQRPVQGSWSHYGPWDECSATCGGGKRMRTRTCSTASCEGNSTETGKCNVHSCYGPSAPPKSLRAVTRTMYSIGVKWDEVPKSSQNGDIMSYIVRYHSGEPSEQQRKKVPSADPSTRFANLTHLTKNTTYTITVLASNDNGTGPASDPIVVATSDGSVFQCPLKSGDLFYKDPNSCFRYYRCYNDGNAVQHEHCPAGTEFKSSQQASPCDHSGNSRCHV